MGNWIEDADEQMGEHEKAVKRGRGRTEFGAMGIFSGERFAMYVKSPNANVITMLITGSGYGQWLMRLTLKDLKAVRDMLDKAIVWLESK